MASEVSGYYKSSKSIEEQCKCYLFYHVVITLDDGSMVDGIIEEINGGNIRILIGQDMMEDKMNSSRQIGQPNRFRRFMPGSYPINRINRIGLLPYPILPIYPFPYPYPYYPFL